MSLRNTAAALAVAALVVVAAQNANDMPLEAMLKSPSSAMYLRFKEHAAGIASQLTKLEVQGAAGSKEMQALSIKQSELIRVMVDVMRGAVKEMETMTGFPASKEDMAILEEYIKFNKDAKDPKQTRVMTAIGMMNQHLTKYVKSVVAYQANKEPTKEEEAEFMKMKKMQESECPVSMLEENIESYKKDPTHEVTNSYLCDGIASMLSKLQNKFGEEALDKMEGMIRTMALSYAGPIVLTPKSADVKQWYTASNGCAENATLGMTVKGPGAYTLHGAVEVGGGGLDQKLEKKMDQIHPN